MPLDDHQVNEDGEHDPDECEVCYEDQHSVTCECRCGRCCQNLIIEVSLRDAEREPRIRECAPIYADNFGQGPRELIGYILNTGSTGCGFYDSQKQVCTIHETRPLISRVFNCDVEREERWPNE